ncbi:BMP family ABC transporter substrate-binding protein [Falsarthrobacter nasiphocae]|uniref:Basic membrane protein A n=1 Tax=Falsarthrobacter nasiphocae TaxID=189863 RepID=A0AAE3YGD2_9MICC|nr:BMP family ABC transporter substrate-binding protein [Falsarthrobacter nasiphocae]MDR6891664.1 basic membrane protein A [Falsarthrobacter nasiphocae]
MKTSIRRATQSAAALTLGALALSACSAPPAENSSKEAGKNYTGCIVSDAGGFDDQSFNQSSYSGLQRAEKDLGITMKKAESKAKADFTPNLQQMMTAKCNLTITVGYLLSDATKAAAAKNPSAHFAIVDDNQIKADNVKPIIYDTAQAAFLAGYTAAAQSKTGKVGTYGGINIPTVTIFMDGFADGVKYYNEQKGKNVQVLGWDKAKQTGTFTNSFDIVQEGTKATNNLIDAGADVIMPVAGPLAQGTGDAALAANKGGKDVSVIWVDSDGVETAPKYKSVILTSVVKKMDKAVEDVIKADLDGKFSNEPYVGTLENAGTDIAPFHEFDSKVSDETKKEIEQVRKDIIAGKIKVESKASPKS